VKPPVFYRRFDYQRKLLANGFVAALEAGTSTIEAAEPITGATIGYPGWNLMYYMLLSHLHDDRPNTIVETGTNFGLSAIMLGQALKDCLGGGHLHTIEIEPDVCERARLNISASGVSEFITTHLGDSVSTLRELLPTLPPLRAAFLDGCHEHDHVIREFELVEKQLEPTGLVIMDNTYGLMDVSLGEEARVHEALKTIKERWGGNIVNFEKVSWYTPGMAVWQR
jgi:Methyltransferase domain